jgi:hypothetical protein
MIRASSSNGCCPTVNRGRKPGYAYSSTNRFLFFMLKIKPKYINEFKHPFITAFIKEIDIQKEMYFGTVRKWIAGHCANVPLPRPYEVTKNVQILYHWIETLSNGKYKVDVPGSHSERIRKNLEIFRT